MNPDFLYYKWIVVYQDDSYIKELDNLGTLWSIREASTDNISHLSIESSNELYVISPKLFKLYTVLQNGFFKDITPMETCDPVGNIDIKEYRSSRVLLNRHDDKKNFTTAREFVLTDELDNYISVEFKIYDRELFFNYNGDKRKIDLGLPKLSFRSAENDLKLYLHGLNREKDNAPTIYY